MWPAGLASSDPARELAPPPALSVLVLHVFSFSSELLLKKRLIDKGESKDAGGAGADPQWMPTEQELLAAGAERNDGKSVKIADGGAICVGPSLKHILPDHRGKPLEKIPSPYATIFNSVVLALRSLDDPYGWVIHLVALAWVGRCSLFSETRHGRLFRVIGHFNKVCYL